MGYFEFLNSSRKICLPLNISEKLHWQNVFEKQEAETHCLYPCLYDVIPTHPEQQHPPLEQTGTTTIFSFEYQYLDPHSGCNSGTDFIVVLEYIVFQLFEQIS